MLVDGITQVDIAASVNLTGSAVLGGDWVLEANTGVIEKPISPDKRNNRAYAKNNLPIVYYVKRYHF